MALFLGAEGRGAIISHGKAYAVSKGGGGMKNRQIKVRCVYQDAGKAVSDLLMESFYLYLSRMLAG